LGIGIGKHFLEVRGGQDILESLFIQDAFGFFSVESPSRRTPGSVSVLHALKQTRVAVGNQTHANEAHADPGIGRGFLRVAKRFGTHNP
jgi:hypothetical protein